MHTRQISQEKIYETTQEEGIVYSNIGMAPGLGWHPNKQDVLTCNAFSDAAR